MPSGPRLDDRERAVLTAFADLEAKDGDGAWACYHADIISAAGGDMDLSNAVCRSLRKRKLLQGQGRGLHAAYWPTDKGKEALG